MAYNRELSQFGSFVGVNDITKNISIASTVRIDGNLGVGTTGISNSRVSVFGGIAVDGENPVVYNSQNWISEYGDDSFGVGVGNTYTNSKSIAFDSLGNTYAVGSIYGYPSTSSPGVCYLTKFNSLGVIIWQLTFNLPENPAKIPFDEFSVSVDYEDNIILSIGGYLSYSPYLKASCLIKLNSSGNIIWQRGIGFPGISYGPVISSVGVGSTGNLYASMDTYGDEGYVFKYDKNGNLQYQKKPNVRISSIGIGSTCDSIYVAGFNHVVKYDSNLNFIWSKNVNKDVVYNVDLQSLILDSDENIHIVGNIQKEQYGDRDIYASKFDKNGNLIWQNVIGISYNNEYKGFEKIALDSSNNLYFTLSVENEYNVIIVKLDSDGNLAWQRKISSGNANQFIYENGIDTFGSNKIAIHITNDSTDNAIIANLKADGDFIGQYGEDINYTIKNSNLILSPALNGISASLAGSVIDTGLLSESAGTVVKTNLNFKEEINYQYVSGGNSLEINGKNLQVNTINMYDENGNLGIGVTNPTTKVQINGILGFKRYAADDGYNVLIGDENTGVNLQYYSRYNNFIGAGAGSNSCGDHNNFFGYYAGFFNSGCSNLFIGECAGYCNSGYDNVFIGRNAGYRNQAKQNVFVGPGAGCENTTGEYNFFFGANVGRNNTTGSYNIFFGMDETGEGNTTGSYNIILGGESGYSNETGSYNIMIGSFVASDEADTVTDASYKLLIGNGYDDVYSFDARIPENSKQLAIGLNTTGTTEYWVTGDSDMTVKIGNTPTFSTSKFDGVSGIGTANSKYQIYGYNPNYSTVTIPSDLSPESESAYSINVDNSYGTYAYGYSIPYDIKGQVGIASTIPTYGTLGNNYFGAPAVGGYWDLTIPFDIYPVGIASTNKVYVGTNSYLTFGGGSIESYVTESFDNPPLPKIAVSSGRRLAKQIYTNTTGTTPNRTFWIRYEGLSTPGLYEINSNYYNPPSPVDFEPDLIWEITFYENEPNRFEIHTEKNPLIPSVDHYNSAKMPLKLGGAIGINTTNILIGDATTSSSGGIGNLVLGHGAKSSGNYNNFFGFRAGTYSESNKNNYIGNFAGHRDTFSGYPNNDAFNIFLGECAGYFNSGSNNIFSGECVGFKNSGNNGIFFGRGGVGLYNEASENIFIGSYTGYKNISGCSNIFIGCGAGRANTSGNYNIFIGGDEAGDMNTEGSNNIFIGLESGDGNTTGSYNMFFGNYVGPGDGNNIGSGDVWYKILIGQGYCDSYYFDSPNQNTSKQFAVGLNTTGNSEYWIVGNEKMNIGIGTTNPTSKLHVIGNVNVGGIVTATNLIVGTSGTTITTTGIGSVGIGTTNPRAKLDIIGDVRIGSDQSQGVILTSPNGTKYRLIVANNGTVGATLVP